MLIINADDWGGWPSATDGAFECARQGRITSVTAMVFMRDSERGAQLARMIDAGVGLHLNLDCPFTGGAPAALAEHHDRVARFLGRGKYARLLFHPLLASSFEYVFRSQWDEFTRLYGREPTHIDGHHHLHLCANMRGLIPRGAKVRRNFSFAAGEKSGVNRWYRSWIDDCLAGRHRITSHFFSLGRCLQRDQLGSVAALARTSSVELMTHPEVVKERAFLLSDGFAEYFNGTAQASYAEL